MNTTTTFELNWNQFLILCERDELFRLQALQRAFDFAGKEGANLVEREAQHIVDRYARTAKMEGSHLSAYKIAAIRELRTWAAENIPTVARLGYPTGDRGILGLAVSKNLIEKAMEKA
jgi:hypothetical protein